MVPCPHCHLEINENATFCRHCGSDASTGWSNEPNQGAIDWNDDDDYADSVEREFGSNTSFSHQKKSPIKASRGIPLWVALTAGFILLLFLLQLLF